MRPPHARPDPRYFPTTEEGEPLAMAFLGLAGIVALFVLAFVLLPVLT